MGRTICLDVETTAAPRHHPWLEGSALVTVHMADTDGWVKSWVINHSELDDGVDQRTKLDEIQAELLTATRLVGHNLKFDYNWAKSVGLMMDHLKLFCTQIAEYMIRGQNVTKGDLQLFSVAEHYGATPKDDKVQEFWNSGYDTTDIPLDILVPYGERDVLSCLEVFNKQIAILMKLGMAKLTAVEMETIRPLSHIELNGMYFDRTLADELIEEIRGELAGIDADLQGHFGWDCNINSNDELSAALYGGVIKREGEEWVIREFKNFSKYYPRKCVVETEVDGLGFKPPKDSELAKEGYWSTSKDTIKQLGARTRRMRDVKELLLKRSVLQKALSTFVGKDGKDKGLINKVMSDGAVHPQYNQTVTRTARLSSKDPNGQNFPRKGTSPIKRVFKSKLGVILNCDLSQLEWRVAAFLSQDPVMIREILDGVDVHTENAKAIFGVSPGEDGFDEKRTLAKIVTFRLLYGGTALGFYYDQSMPNWSKAKWQGVVEAFYSKYRRLQAWQNENISAVYRNGGVLVNPTGRRFHFEMTEKGYKKPSICNYPVQSLATADIMKLAMNKIFQAIQKRDLKTRMIGQVHDSLVFDCPLDEARTVTNISLHVFRNLPKYIEQTYGFKYNIPMDGDVEYGYNYGELKRVPA